MKHLLIIALAVVLAVLVGNASRMMIATETIDWDVADAQGHGPEPGSLEWQHELKRQSKTAGLGFGLLTFVIGTGLGYVGHHTHKQRKQLEG